ncbi:hypothetical protein ONZ45_g12446 [Pleurotus djamor]|nr:hypothetical protein ONZ45_g12446 [Pleurotus djamor]
MSSLPPSSPPNVKNDEPVPADIDIPDDYVTYTLKNQKPLPPFQWANLPNELNWISFTLITLTPIIGFVGAYFTKLRWETFLFAVFYYFVTGLGITAGYHRLWAHRSYNAGLPLQYALALAGSGACEGSIKWWSRGHRAHHRYTDTELDPYNAHKGLFYSHVGWMLVKPRRKPGVADVSDLSKNAVVKWQHRHYVKLILIMGFLLPSIIPWLGWGDFRGGFIYAGVLRLVFVHHSTFCVNSLAHWLGEAPFDDKHTPRDHLVTALVTIGEGYHNFHHQFPMDYRNAIKWYQYDPTKWFIWSMQQLGFASHLKKFPDNEVTKGVLTMQLKKLRELQEKLDWPSESCNLPVVSWESYQEEAQKRPLILISGFIHDVSDFMEEHPGGRHLLVKMIGKDATTAFFGGVYDHSNAAHNLLSMKRVGVLHGGQPHALEDKAIPPSQRLKIARYNELNSGGSWSSGSDAEGRGAPDAPKFSGRGIHLRRFFEDIEFLAVRAELTDEEDKIKWTLYYLEDVQWETWKNVIPEAKGDDWSAFKLAVLRLYGEADEDSRYRIRDIKVLCEEQSQKPVGGVEDVLRYYHQFLTIGMFLKERDQVGVYFLDELYLHSFEATFQKKLLRHLRWRNPLDYLGRDHPFEEVHKLAISILKLTSPVTIPDNTTSTSLVSLPSPPLSSPPSSHPDAGDNLDTMNTTSGAPPYTSTPPPPTYPRMLCAFCHDPNHTSRHQCPSYQAMARMGWVYTNERGCFTLPNHQEITRAIRGKMFKEQVENWRRDHNLPLDLADPCPICNPMSTSTPSQPVSVGLGFVSVYFSEASE